MEWYRLNEIIDERTLANINGYTVDSDKLRGVYYIVDEGKFAIIRQGEMAVWGFDNTPAAAQCWIDPIKREIIGIYNDIRELGDKDVKKICKGCGAEFETTSRGRVYCTPECREENMYKPKPKRQSQISAINQKARELGITYGQYQAMRAAGAIE